MKKNIIVLLIGAALLSACGNEATVTETPVTSSVPEPAETSVAEAEVSSESGVKEATVSEAEDDEDFGSEFATMKKDQTIDETVLYEQNDVKITATGISYGNYSVDLEVVLENNSDKPLTFLAGTLGYSCNSVNGWMVEDGYMNEEIEPGGSVETAIGFNSSELLLHGITEIADIQVGFEVEDEDYNRFYTGPLTVETPLAASYDYDNDGYRKAINSKALQYTYDYTIGAFSETEAYNSGGIRILSEGYMTNTDGDRTLMLEVKNDNDFSVYLTTENIKVNDTTIYEDTWSYDSINPGCRALTDIRLDNILDEEEWEEYGISEIESISLTVTVKNEDGVVIAEPKELTIGV